MAAQKTSQPTLLLSLSRPFKPPRASERASDLEEVTVGNAVKKLLGGDLECGGNSCVRRIRTRSKKAQVGDSVANPTFAVVFLGGGDSGARFQRDPRKKGRKE